MNRSLKLVYILTIFLSSGCSLSYVVKQGYFQMKLLSGAEPIEIALRKPDLDSYSRTKLMLIFSVREFSEKSLKLTVNKNYKNINLNWDKIIYSASASDSLKFNSYTWWFPVLGSVPYKGFFEEADCDQELAVLQKKGLDTQKGRIGGYSTLGFFSDPVWPSMLKLSEEDLVDLIIHELAHSTIYFANQTTFNESFASFVGSKGAELFFTQKYGLNSNYLVELENNKKDQKSYHDFFSDLHARLNSVYISQISDQEKSRQKQLMLKQAQKDFLLLPISDNFKKLDWSRVNNAYLLSFKRYNYDEAVFAEIFTLLKDDFGKFLNFVKYYGQASEPFLALRKQLDIERTGSP